MKNLLFTILILLTDYSVYSQDIYNLTYEFIDQYDYVCEAQLIINGNQNVFKIHDDREGGVQQHQSGEIYNINNDKLSKFTYYDGEYIYNRVLYKRKELLYKFNDSKLKWDFTNLTKVIEGYKCNQAKINLHGRSYTVWYTMEIPINYGPLRLNGLPGLVIALNEDNNYCSLRLLKIEKTNNPDVFNSCKMHFSNQKIMTYEQYKETTSKAVIRSKIKLMSLIAEQQEKTGGSISATFGKNQEFFFLELIDIPDGLIDELKNIN